jgi:hypothetical protein
MPVAGRVTTSAFRNQNWGLLAECLTTLREYGNNGSGTEWDLAAPAGAAYAQQISGSPSGG